MEYFTLLTNLGATKIAAASAANSTVNLTQIAVGDGSGTVPVPDISQTALVNEVFRTDLSELTQDEINTNHFIARSVIPEDEGNFWIREIGVFDADGDLIAVGNYPETYKSILTEGAAKSVDLSVVFEVANADVVNLTIDPTIVMASQDYVNQKLLQKLDKSDFISLITANCLVGGTINATEVDTTTILDIYNDGSCLECYPLNSDGNSLGSTNATLSNITFETGVFENCAKFNGVDSVMALDITKPNNIFTISNWYKKGSIDSQFGLGRKGSNIAYTQAYWFRVLGHSFSSGKSQVADYGSVNVSLDDGKFHLYSCTVDLINSELRFYIDGVYNYTHALSSNELACINAYTNLRGLNDETSYFLSNGSIEQIRLFDKELTDIEHLKLYLEKYLTSVTLDNANIAYSNGKSKGYDLAFELITSKALSELTFQTGWNEVIKTKAGAYTVSQNLSLLAENSDGVSNYFSINDGKYYDKDGVHLENQAPILQVLFDGTNIIEVKKVEDFIGYVQNVSENMKIVAFGIVSNNNRYVLDNPFGNEVHEKCLVQCEIKINGTWYVSEGGNTGSYSRGTKGWSLAEGIVVQTGDQYVNEVSLPGAINAYIGIGSLLSSAECRVKVFKVGN